MKNNNKKTFIIIGATGGIGSVLTTSFYKQGYNLVLSSRKLPDLEKLAYAMDESRVLVVAADATNPDDVERLYAEAKSKFGTIDAIVVSAGSWEQLSIDKPLKEASALADKHYQIFFKIPFNAVYGAQEVFRNQKGLLILNISSHAAVRFDLDGNMTYSPMKAASHALVYNLIHELKINNIVNIKACDLMPAIVNTKEAAKWLDTAEKKAMAVQPEAIADWIIENVDNDHIESEKLFPSKLVL